MYLPDHEVFRAAVEDLECEIRELQGKIERRDIVIAAFRRQHQDDAERIAIAEAKVDLLDQIQRGCDDEGGEGIPRLN